jgi:hypothetical protein
MADWSILIHPSALRDWPCVLVVTFSPRAHARLECKSRSLSQISDHRRLNRFQRRATSISGKCNAMQPSEVLEQQISYSYPRCDGLSSSLRSLGVARPRTNNSSRVEGDRVDEGFSWKLLLIIDGMHERSHPWTLLLCSAILHNNHTLLFAKV